MVYFSTWRGNPRFRWESILLSYIDMLNLDCFYNFWVNKRNKYILNLWRGFLLTCSKFLVYISSSDFASWKLRKRPAVLVKTLYIIYSLTGNYSRWDSLASQLELLRENLEGLGAKKIMLKFLAWERINSILLLRRLALLRGNKFSLNCGGEVKWGWQRYFIYFCW